MKKVLFVVVLSGLISGCGDALPTTPSRLVGYVNGVPCYSNILVVNGCVINTQVPVPISQTTPAPRR